jgi:GAF domain
MSAEKFLAAQLDALDAKLLQFVNLDASISAWCLEVCSAMNCERIGLFLANEDGVSITSKVTTGLDANTRVKLPISPKSLAGFVALSKKQLNIEDVYDAKALQGIHPELRFVDAVDKSTGFRSEHMIISPILAGNTLLGVFEVINNKHGQPFSQLELDACTRISKTLATALQRPRPSGSAPLMATTKAPTAPLSPKPIAAQPAALRPGQPSKYDGLVNAGAISKADLQDCLAKRGDKDGTIEQLMIDEHQVTSAQIGQALALFFGVPYEPYSKARFNTEKLHGALKRDFLSEQGWIPLEESFERDKV